MAFSTRASFVRKWLRQPVFLTAPSVSSSMMWYGLCPSVVAYTLYVWSSTRYFRSTPVSLPAAYVKMVTGLSVSYSSLTVNTQK